MLTFRKGSAGSSFVAGVMAEYYSKETEVSGMQEKLASYYGKTGEKDFATGMARGDTDPRLAALLGIDTSKPIETTELANILAGLRGDGKPIEGRSTQGVTDKKARISYIDLTFSAPKSFSVGLALANTHAERAIFDRAHRDAVASVMADIGNEIGLARRGKGGSKGEDQGSVTWFTFDHYAVRPTTKTAVIDNGEGHTVLQEVPVAGDPGRHTHAILPNVVLTEEGRVGGLFWKKTQGKVHEWGAVYQGYLGNNLRLAGIEFELDKEKTLMGRLPAIPRWVDDLYSKFHRNGEDAARKFAADHGQDWDAMSGHARVEYLRGSIKKIRQSKGDGIAAYDDWQKQADDAGYQHRSALRPGQEQELEPAHVRLPAAFETSLPILAPQLEKRSVFDGSVARIAAAKSLIHHGIDTPADINVITGAYRTEGVVQDGQRTWLEWGREGVNNFASFTTGRHIEQENEAIALLRAGAEDKSSALTPGQIEAAVRKVEREEGITFKPKQREMIDRLGTGGRVAAGVGGAGVGKTTIMRPLVEAWHEQGRETIGVTLAWRHTHALSDAGVGKKKVKVPDTRRLQSSGIDESRSYSMAAFLYAVEKGFITAGPKTVVVVDEVGLVGTRQQLEMARLREKHGFQLVEIGDDKQCTAIEAGAPIALLRKALGNEQVPELLETIRQNKDRDKETVNLFRHGKAAEALVRKDEDKTLLIVPGGYREAVETAVALWQKRVEENKHDPRYTIGISVPTNRDVREVGTEIRKLRKAAGEIGRDDLVIKATDQNKDGKTEYDLPVSVGERVRLFNKVHAVFPSGKASRFADNGTVAVIERVRADGLDLKNPKGNIAFISWDQLRDPKNGRIRLTYGDVVTIDSRQSDTLTEHITCMPDGSQAVNGFKAYVADSRHREWSAIVTSQGAEQAEIEARRPLGDPRNQITARAKVKASIMENMARNLSRQPEKQLATDLLAKVNEIRRGTIRAMQAAWHRQEVREAKGQSATATPVNVVEKQEAVAVEAAIAAVKEQQKAVSQAVNVVKSTQPEQPKREPRREMSETELVADFAATLSQAGFRLKGPPVMDGKSHRAPVEGDKGTQQSGLYAGHLDYPPNGRYQNYKTGEAQQRWKPDVVRKAMTDEEKAAFEAKVADDRAARIAARLANEEKTAALAKQTWDTARAADPKHPYLARKQIMPHWMRQDRNGDLLVPMQDASGKIWNLQRIPEDQVKPKLFMSGRTKGLYAVLGGLEPGKPAWLGEGAATLASLYETTAIPSIITFYGNNILPVAKTIREQYPTIPILYGADNDHHLPRRNPPMPNVGLDKAHEAAKEIGGIVVAPKFAANDKGTDWNDYSVRNGSVATRENLKAALAEVGVQLPPPAKSKDAGREV